MLVGRTDLCSSTEHCSNEPPMVVLIVFRQRVLGRAGACPSAVKLQLMDPGWDPLAEEDPEGLVLVCAAGTGFPLGADG